jgi:hypothetical protein
MPVSADASSPGSMLAKALLSAGVLHGPDKNARTTVYPCDAGHDATTYYLVR